jgi:putative DNA primase/helicase
MKETPMPLRTIVRALGGDLYDGGRRANIPAPGHSSADRSVSLLFRDGRIIVNTFGDGGWREVLDHLRRLGLVDAHNAPSSLAAPPPASFGVRPPDWRRCEAARALWRIGQPIAGRLAERHCRLRNIQRALPDEEVMRHAGETPVSVYGPSPLRRPALLAAIRDPAGAVTAVEITYLAPNGCRARDLRLSRKTVGLVPAGSAVRIDPPAAEMLVAEGVFTTLSATERFGLPGWALLSTRNLRGWTPPPKVRSVLIAADRGTDGAASARVLAARLTEAGLQTRVMFPVEPYGDFNDAAADPAGKAGGREGAGCA